MARAAAALDHFHRGAKPFADALELAVLKKNQQGNRHFRLILASKQLDERLLGTAVRMR